MTTDIDRTGRAILIVAPMTAFVLVLAFALGMGVGQHQGRRMAGADHAVELASAETTIASLTDSLTVAHDTFALETLASWYGGAHHGRLTASGVLFDRNALTAASPWLPFGTRVEVTRWDNGRSVRVTVTDRGPHPRLGRGIDLSEAAAAYLGMIEPGVVAVRLRPVVGG
jgi:rare lipoprotein A